MDYKPDAFRYPSSGMVYMSLIGDALALGSHWIYDQSEILSQLGRISTYHAPISSYHPGKKAGDLTHYGDQIVLLLESLAENKKFCLDSFAHTWRIFWEDKNTTSYRDHATKETLQHLQEGMSPQNAGSHSQELAGAGRITPLFLLPWKTEDALLQAVQLETAFTHQSPIIIETAIFFSRILLAARTQSDISATLKSIQHGAEWSDAIHQWVNAAEKSADSKETDSDILKSYGLSCSIEGAFPGVCHLLFRYPNDPVKALTENAIAGGDNAARGLLLGAVYGANFPLSSLPKAWIDGLNMRPKVERLIQSLVP